MRTVSPVPGHSLGLDRTTRCMPDEADTHYEVQNRRGTSVSGMGRFDVSSYEYFSTRLDAVNERLTAQLNFQRDLIQAQFLAAQKAIEKSDEASDKRFASVNEFRAQLSDQAARFASKEALDSNARESRVAHDLLAKDIQRAIDIAAKALDDHNVRDNANHTDLADRLTREVSELRKLQYQPGELAGVTAGIDSRVKALESHTAVFRGRDEQHERGLRSIEWGVVLGVSIVNVLAVVVVHYLR